MTTRAPRSWTRDRIPQFSYSASIWSERYRTPAQVPPQDARKAATTTHGLLSLLFFFFNLIFCPILFASLSLTSSPPFLVFSSPSAKLTTAVPTALTPGSCSVLTIVPRPGCERLSPPLATVPCLGAVGEIPVVNTSPGEGRSMELRGTCLNFWPGCQQAAYLCAAAPAEAAFSRDRAPSERCRGAALEALSLSSE